MSDNGDDYWPTRAHLPGRLIGGVYRCRNHFWERDQRVLTKYKVSWTQFLTLMSLRDAAPDFSMTPSELCRLMQITSGGMSKIQLSLERRFLISRVENPADARSHNLVLTPQGKELAETVYRKLSETNMGHLRDALSEQECEDLARLVRKLSSHLDSLADSSEVTDP